MLTTPVNDQPPPPRRSYKRAVVGTLLLTAGAIALSMLLYTGIRSARIAAIRSQSQ